MLFFLITLIIFLLQCNVSFACLELFERVTCFITISIIFCDKSDICFFLFSHAKHKEQLLHTLFFPNLFQSSLSDGKLIPSRLYLFMKGLIFCYSL